MKHPPSLKGIIDRHHKDNLDTLERSYASLEFWIGKILSVSRCLISTLPYLLNRLRCVAYALGVNESNFLSMADLMVWVKAFSESLLVALLKGSSAWISYIHLPGSRRKSY